MNMERAAEIVRLQVMGREDFRRGKSLYSCERLPLEDREHWSAGWLAARAVYAREYVGGTPPPAELKFFTPGPWRFVAGQYIRSVRDQIARVWMMRGGEGKANAYLIAAAPDLYNALLEVIETNDVGQGMEVRARLALKKARGELDIEPDSPAE